MSWHRSPVSEKPLRVATGSALVPAEQTADSLGFPMKAQNAHPGKLPCSTSQNPQPSSETLVLCVDDDASHLKVTAELMRMNGYTVINWTNYRTALKVFRTRPVALVVLDYSMPKMNGAQIARTMRGEKRNAPIVMLSGHSHRPHDVDDAVNAYIVKGQSPQVLLRKMQELLWQQSVRLFPSGKQFRSEPPGECVSLSRKLTLFRCQVPLDVSLHPSADLAGTNAAQKTLHRCSCISIEGATDGCGMRVKTLLEEAQNSTESKDGSRLVQLQIGIQNLSPFTPHLSQAGLKAFRLKAFAHSA